MLNFYTKENQKAFNNFLKNTFDNGKDKETTSLLLNMLLDDKLLNIFKLKDYPKNNIYLNPLIDKKIFELLNVLHKIYEKYSSEDRYVDITIEEGITAIYKNTNPTNFKLMHKKHKNGLVYMETIFVSDYYDDDYHKYTGSNHWKEIIKDGGFLATSNYRSLLKNIEDSSIYSLSKELNIVADSNFYPIINHNTKDINISASLLNSPNFSLHDGLELTSNIMVENKIDDINNSEVYKKLLNILSDAEKLIQFLYIYDSYIEYIQKIKYNLKIDLKKQKSKDKVSIDNVSIQFFWIAIAKKLNLKPKTAKNYHSLIKRIITERLYELV